MHLKKKNNFGKYRRRNRYPKVQSIKRQLNDAFNRFKPLLIQKKKKISKENIIYRKKQKKTLSKALIYNNIQTYLNLSYDSSGKTSFDINELKR